MGRRWIDLAVDAGLHDIFNDFRDLLADLFYVLVLFIPFVILAFIVAALVAGNLAVDSPVNTIAIQLVCSRVFALPSQFPIVFPMRTKEVSLVHADRWHSKR